MLPLQTVATPANPTNTPVPRAARPTAIADRRKSPASSPTPARRAQPTLRVHAFIDFWNFHLSLERWQHRFPLDWKRLGPWLAREAGDACLAPGHRDALRFDGLHLYMSYDPSSPKDAGLLRWANNVLARLPQVDVVLKERRSRRAPSCPTCHTAVPHCPSCRADMRGTVEKGIDTAIVTDMLGMAYDDLWDVAILVSADSDFVPAVDLLGKRGRRVIQGRFPPAGAVLARRSWASFDVTKNLAALTRPAAGASGA